MTWSYFGSGKINLDWRGSRLERKSQLGEHHSHLGKMTVIGTEEVTVWLEKKDRDKKYLRPGDRLAMGRRGIEARESVGRSWCGQLGRLGHALPRPGTLGRGKSVRKDDGSFCRYATEQFSDSDLEVHVRPPSGNTEQSIR